MNIINLSVDFVKRTIKQTGVNLTSGDYNSTKLVFEFDDEYEGTKVCEIAKKEDKDGNNEAIFAEEIINNEVILGALADITDDNGYIKYKDNSSNIYWYDEDNSQLYDSEYNTSSISLDTLTKVQQNVSIFDEAGKYVLEVSLYGEDSKLTSACTDLVVKPGMVRVGDLKVAQYIPVFDTLMNQATTIIDELEAADETMESHETTRQSNETARQSNETTRQSNETTRQSNETSRTNAETSRAAAETTRQSNETSRQSAETSRATAETARATAETNRSSAESTRQSNESSRTSAESARNTAEQGRASAETSRVSAESTRASNESSRQSAENTRDSNETTRQSNEASRTSAEEARATAETGRSTAETTRASNETTRQSNETTRQSNETTRQSNEETRQANELIREAKIVEIKAENNRILKNTPKGMTDINPATINDGADLPLDDFKLIGQTETSSQIINNVEGNIQINKSNKNLLPFTNQNFIVNGVRFYVQDGNLYLNGTSTGETLTNNPLFKNNFSFTLPAGTYRFSRQNSTGTQVTIALKKYNDDTNITSIVNAQNTSSPFTLQEETKVYIGFYIYQKTFNNEIFSLQIEEGNTTTDYISHAEKIYNFTLLEGQVLTENDYIDKNGIHTSELIPFTPEQQAVIDEIINDGTYKEVTHYIAEANINPDMEVTYYKDLETLINNIESRLSLLE